MEPGRGNRQLWVRWYVLESGPKEGLAIGSGLFVRNRKKWIEPFGDMRQELMFIGQNLRQEEMVKALDYCLLEESEVLKGKQYWYSLPDPFPEWERQ